jgi:hypothetical protein
MRFTGPTDAAFVQAINIQEVRNGIDFYFSHKQHAIKLVDFIDSVVPIKCVIADVMSLREEFICALARVELKLPRD